MNRKTFTAVALSAVMMLSDCGSKADDPAKLLEKGQYEQAAEVYQAALENDEKNVDLYIGLADSFLGMGECEAAIDVLCDGFENTNDKTLPEKMAKITSDLYNTASDKGDYQVVLYCCERSLECGENSELYEISAKCYLNMDQAEDAIETVKNGVENTGDTSVAENVASYIYTLGSKAYTAGDKVSALDYFKKVVEIDSENADAVNMINAIGENPQNEEKKDNKTEEVQTSESDKKDQPEPQPQQSEKPAENENKAVPNMTSAQPAGSYTVQIGAYSEAANAESKVSKATAAGLSASYYQSGGLYRVTIGTFATESEANAAVAKANAAGFDAIIV